MRNLLFGTVILAFTLTVSANSESPYTGQHTRDIKALSNSDIEGYLTGKGMGFAKAAELNHYPGPRHVLDLADQLKLTEKQKQRTQALFENMRNNAILLGKHIVKKEAQLDNLFAQEKIDNNSLEKLLKEIGALQAKLRYVHLETHLQQRQLLTKHQIVIYDQLRGYGSNNHGTHRHRH